MDWLTATQLSDGRIGINEQAGSISEPQANTLLRGRHFNAPKPSLGNTQNLLIHEELALGSLASRV